MDKQKCAIIGCGAVGATVACAVAVEEAMKG